jgi:hypothetical protein
MQDANNVTLNLQGNKLESGLKTTGAYGRVHKACRKILVILSDLASDRKLIPVLLSASGSHVSE